MYAYIDESGDTGYTKKSTRYFILTTVIVDDPFVLRRIVKDMHKFKMNKKNSNMIHSYLESDVVKKKLAKKLANVTSIRCKCFVFDKNEIKEKDLYMSGLRFISEYFDKSEVLTVTIARRDTRSSYNSMIVSIFNSHNIIADFSYPTVEKSLQIADFYSWACFSHLEHNTPKYFLRIEAQIELICKTKPSRHV